jgi:hypothetical protein
MFGYNGEDSPMNDVCGVIGASIFKYLADSLQKKEPGQLWPQALEGAVGIGMLAGRHYVSGPTWKAVMEASGYTLTASSIGTYFASNYKTIGNIPAGNIPTMKTAASASAVRGIVSPVIAPPVVSRPQVGPQWTPWNEIGYTD